MPDGLQQSFVVKPMYPLQCCQLQRFTRFPWPAFVDNLRFVQAVDGLGQGVVVGVPSAAYRGRQSRFCQALGVAQ